MDEADVIAEAARSAGVEPETAREVLEAAAAARSKEALKRAQAALTPPPDAGRTGFFPAFRRRRHPL
ncbi:MAG TPA: hypothetical protein VG388_09680 [Solirubrobacteraceae bacterium]|nr:hypothetical protein [Solirubrobacteraceae bacterium]